MGRSLRFPKAFFASVSNGNLSWQPSGGDGEQEEHWGAKALPLEGEMLLRVHGMEPRVPRELAGGAAKALSTAGKVLAVRRDPKRLKKGGILLLSSKRMGRKMLEAPS